MSDAVSGISSQNISYSHQIQAASSALFLLVSGIALFIIFTQCHPLSNAGSYFMHDGMPFTIALSPLAGTSLIAFVVSSYLGCRKPKQSSPDNITSSSPEKIQPAPLSTLPAPTFSLNGLEETPPLIEFSNVVSQKSSVENLRTGLLPIFFEAFKNLLMSLITANYYLGEGKKREKTTPVELTTQYANIETHVNAISHWMQEGLKDVRFIYLYGLKNSVYESLPLRSPGISKEPKKFLSNLISALARYQDSTIKVLHFHLQLVLKEFESNNNLLTPLLTKKILSFESIFASKENFEELVKLVECLLEHVPLSDKSLLELKQAFDDYFFANNELSTTMQEELQKRVAFCKTLDLSQKSIDQLIQKVASATEKGEQNTFSAFKGRIASGAFSLMQNLGSTGQAGTWIFISKQIHHFLPFIPYRFDLDTPKDKQKIKMQSHLDGLVSILQKPLLDGMMASEKKNPYRQQFKTIIEKAAHESAPLLESYDKNSNLPLEAVIHPLLNKIRGITHKFNEAITSLAQ